MATLITIGGAGAAGPPGEPGEPGGSAVAPEDFTLGTLDYEWVETDTGPVVEILVPVTPPDPMGETIGGHLYAEGPDRSQTARFRIGESALGGSDGIQGPW